MSYILDALKKIEHEKSVKNGADGRSRITGDLFHERKRTPARSGYWKTAVAVTAATLIATSGTWFALRPERRVAVQPRPDVPLPVAAAPAISPPAVPAVPPHTAADAAVPTVTQASAPNNRAVSEDESNSPLRDRKIKMPQKTAAPTPVRTVSVAQIQPPADIKLSGIAWQDERSGRRAVINGFLLKEGVVVSGARITDILADRVKFSSPAGVFEIKLDAVLSGEGKK